MTLSRLSTATRILGILTLIAMAVSLYMALIWSPPERTMLGDSVRILYFHAPAAWTAYLSFGVVAIASVMFRSALPPVKSRSDVKAMRLPSALMDGKMLMPSVRSGVAVMPSMKSASLK